MKELLEILAEFAKRYPNLQYPMAFAICAVIVLIWKLIEQLAPKAIVLMAKHFRRTFLSRRTHAEQEAMVRSFVTNTQVLNWLSCTKSLSKYHLKAAIDDIYFPLKYKLMNGPQQYASTTIDRILYDNGAFAIVGPPGSGKSTVLSKIAIVYAKDAVDETFGIKESRLPLFLSLKALPSTLAPLQNVLTDSLRRAGCDLKESFVLEQLKNQRCIVLLDGLDETGDNPKRREVVDWITNSLAVFPGNRFIVTCRNVEWDLVNVPNMPYANLLSLTEHEVEGIINQWEQHSTDKPHTLRTGNKGDTGSLTKLLSKAENRNLMLLAGNPLLLTIMIILRLRGINIPVKKVELYNIFVRTLLGEWDEVKNIGHDITGIRLQKRIKLFQRLSLFLLEKPSLNEVIDLRDTELASFLMQQFTNLCQECQDMHEFLDNIVSRTGVLSKSGDDLFLFSNRGFLEFLAAKELADNLDFSKIHGFLTIESWRETIIQFASLVTDPTPLIRRIVAYQDCRQDFACFILARTLLESVTVDNNLRQKAITLINDHLYEGLTAGKIDVDLIKDGYALSPDYWLDLITKVLLQKGSIPIQPRVACEVLSSLNDTAALDRLRDIAASGDTNIIKEILRSLKLSMSTQALDILWSFADDISLREIVIDSLVAKGDLVIDSCVKVLSSTSAGQSPKEIASSVLCRINDPTVIKTIGHLMKSAPPSLHNHFVSELHQTYFTAYKLKEAEKVAEMMRDVFEPSFYALFLKRYLDVLLGVASLLCLLPILLVTCLLIKITSPGPVFFCQRRVGINGQEFLLYKLRTMMQDVEKLGPVWAAQADPRITRVGRILRMTRLDDLPQLINVVRGEMSWIGPRPERPEFVRFHQKVIPHYLLRHNVKPGLTGLSQVTYPYGGSPEDLRNKFIYDLYYVSNCSFILDLSIYARTILTVLLGRGAR